MRKYLIQYIFVIIFVVMGTLTAYADDSPPDGINGLEIAGDILEYTQENFIDRWRWLGTCIWEHHHGLIPYYTVTPEVDEYLPDLVVSVYNEAGDDPFEEASLSDHIAQEIGNTQMQIAAEGHSLTDGRNSAIRTMTHNSSDITKSVDVIGSPFNLVHLHYAVLTRDTTAYIPYFYSAVDSVAARLGFAEYWEPDKTFSIFGPYIGQSFNNHWTYEFPRDMSVVTDNDYKASLSIALHAADIVTNNNTGHVVTSLRDSCGTNCAVANVVAPTEENRKHPHTIWQEVYPNNINKVEMGKNDLTNKSPYGMGHDDEISGHGNYVFVLWRHYRGCVQSKGGRLVRASVHVPDTKKR